MIGEMEKNIGNLSRQSGNSPDSHRLDRFCSLVAGVTQLIALAATVGLSLALARATECYSDSHATV